jgi:cytochrome oxidase Cu insertion factor (SCO1/SenC/PrrC family)
MRRLLFLSALAAFCAVVVGSQNHVQAHDPADLEIGKVAPDIEGEDIDGVPFKLSDYRGKVVVLDFWGDW